MRIVLFGPPGAGKGSQAKLLVERQGLAHISTGVIIRRAMKADSDLGREARSFVESGALVPGRLVRALAEDAIAAEGYDGFVLDGYPRTLEQARWLSAFLEEHRAPLEAVVSLEVPHEVIVERLSRRRVHRKTGENYHLDHKPPPPDLDPALIKQRTDDQPGKIRTRLDVYEEETAPLKAYYEERGLLVPVDGVGDFEEVHARIEKALPHRAEQPDGAPEAA